MINKNSIIEISQVANGFIVRHGGHNWYDGGNDRRWIGAPDDYLVFRTMAELADFLTEQFSHRAQVTKNDTAAT